MLLGTPPGGSSSSCALALTAPHVARQELIVEAALTGRQDAARAAMATDPLVRDPMAVDAMLDDLCRANTAFLRPEFIDGPVMERP